MADIRNRVTIAKRAAETPGEYLQILGVMGVDVSEASRRSGRADWLYSLAEDPSKRIRGENLGLAYGRKAVEGAMRGNAAIDPGQIAAIAAKAVEVRDYAQLENMASALELYSRYGIRSMADFGSRIATMERRGDDKAASELRLAKETAKELRLLPEAAGARPRTAMDHDAWQRQHADAPARAGEQAARQRQIQQEQQRNDRNRRAR